MFLVTYAAAVLSVLFFTSGVLLFRQIRASSLHLPLGGYCLSAAIWTLGNAVADVAYTEQGLVLASGIAFVGGAVNLFFLLVLVDALVGTKTSTRRLALYALPNIIVSLLAFTEFAIIEVSFPPGSPAQITPGPLYDIALFFLLAGFVYGAVRLVRGIRETEERECRLRLTYSLTGLLIMLAGELAFDVILPLLGELRFYTLGPMFSLAFIVGCGYSILRHRLIKLELVIRALERKVEERTGEIRTLQEEQRQLMLDLSHSLQTPLAILKTKLERIERTTIHDRELVSLEQSVSSLSEFVTDLLSLATLEDSLRKEGREELSFSNLLEELVEEVRVIAEPQGIAIHTDIAPGVQCIGNQKRLREAVMNVVGNSVKYIGDDPKEIYITLDEEGSVIKLTVTDTGIGIPEADLPHIFDRFYRRKVYGIPSSGLGLAIVARTVEEHGGSVAVTSTEGVGSTFTLSFPKRLRTSPS
jgi:signal transduction histidine kinase